MRMLCRNTVLYKAQHIFFIRRKNNYEKGWQFLKTCFTLQKGKCVCEKRWPFSGSPQFLIIGEKWNTDNWGRMAQNTTT
jgi:hypothetical protein